MVESLVSNRRTLVFLIALILIAVGGTFVINFISSSPEKTLTRGLDIDVGDTEVLWDRYEKFDVELSEDLEIKKSGVYHLTGAVDDGMITVDVGDYRGNVKLILDNVLINNEDGPAIYVKSADDIVIETKENTKNYLSSGEVFDTTSFDEDMGGTIYSKGDLSFYGEGFLHVESKYKDAIVGKDDVNIRSGEIEIVSADDGIRGKDSVFVSNGKVKIAAKKDGIKSTNTDVSSKGFVYIENGEIEVNAEDDGIHATTSLVIMDGKINIAQSYEGLEGAKVAINGGDISVNAVDDGINAAGGKDESAFARPGAEKFMEQNEYYIMVNGGNIYVNSSGDGIDSNGKIYLNGGRVVVDGPTDSSDGALDSENGIFFNGGEVIAVGASGMAESFKNNSLSFGVSYYLDSPQAKKTKVEIKDESGNVILSHTSAKAFNHIAFGSEKFEKDKTYNIYVNDKLVESFKFDETIKTIGNNTEGFGGQQPGQPDGQDGQMPTPPDQNGQGGMTPPEKPNM